MKTLISKLKHSIKLKKALYYCIIALTFLYVFCIPSFGERNNFLRYSIYASMALLIGSVVIYCLLYDNFKVTWQTMFVPFFAIFAFIGTSIFSHEFRSWFSLILLTVSFYVFIFAFKIIKNRYLVINIIALAFFAFSIYYIFKYRNEILNFKDYGNKGFRIDTIFDNQNGVAAFAVVGFSLPLFLLLFWKNGFKWLCFFPLLSSLLVGITTGSRTFILMIFVIILVFVYAKTKKHKAIFFIAISILFLLGMIVINLPIMTTIKTRIIATIETIFGTASKVDTSTIERITWMDYAFALGGKNILFGLGSNGFSIYSGVGTYSHSNFSEVFCNFGLIGFILFYFPIFCCLFKTVISKKRGLSFVVSFVIYYLIVSFSNVIYYKKIYYLILAFLFYLAFIDGEDEPRLIPQVNELKKMIFTCDTMSSGGAEKVISTLANEFIKLGIEVSIIGVGDRELPKSFYKLDDGVKYITFANGSGKRVRALGRIFKLRKTIKKEKPDIVISFLPNANIYTCISLIGTGIPYIVSERNDPKTDPKGKITRILKKYSFTHSDGAVFQTNEAKNYYPKKVKNNSVIIPNPLDLKYIPTHTTYTREKVILAVGRLTPQKNYNLLLDAFAKFHKEYRQDYILRIYGEGPLKDELLEYAKSLGINDSVEFMGSDTEWHKKEYRDALFVLSSDYEGMPNALLEAMALGIPCISTDCPCGGPRELIDDGYNGYLVPVGDVDELANKMIEVVKHNQYELYEHTRDMVDYYNSTNISQMWVNYILGLRKENDE